MGIKDKITADVKAAMKRRDQETVDTLRMVVSAIKNGEIEKKSDLDDAAIISLLSTLVKQRREAAGLYRKGDRNDLAEKEEREVEMLKQYMPEEISAGELEGIVADVIKEAGASSMADVGNVMKVVMSKVAGQADGKVVSDIVKAQLSR